MNQDQAGVAAPDPAYVLDGVFRREHGRIVAGLVRSLGSIDLAQDAAAEAYAVAAARWPAQGVPPNPGAWLTTTARNRGIDQLRREASRPQRHREAHRMAGLDDPVEGPGGSEEVVDDRLRLLFTCCHPALAPAARVALTLRLLGGLTTAEIARAFLVPEATMAQRIVRAKAKIRAARIPYRVPAAEELPTRLASVLAVVYVVHTEGHTATAGSQLGRPDLGQESIRLGRLLHELLPDEPETAGLLALMLLSESRRAARTGADGRLVLLADQDRDRWDRALIEEGVALVLQCLAAGRPGPYQLQAAIQAVHARAASLAQTDWPAVVSLYLQLESIAPSPVVRLNRAVAVAEADGPLAGLALLDGLALESYPPYHAVRGELLARAGDREGAAAAMARAAELTGNEVERTHLTRRAAQLDAGRLDG